MRRTLVAGLVATLVAGCSPGADLTSVQAAVGVFHQEIDAGSFDQIYADAAPQLKQATTQASLVQLLTAIHRKLGAFKSGTSGGWNDSINTSGHFVTLIYNANYTRGAATENFVFEVGGSKPLLLGYHINSTALILN